MALLWVEGFDRFGTSLDYKPQPNCVVSRKYITQGEDLSRFQIKTGKMGGYALCLPYDTYGWMKFPAMD